MRYGMRITVDDSYEGIPEPAGDGATARICGALTALEEAFEADRPEAVVVADDSDAALAAALVATKLLIPLEAAEGAVTDSPNGRVLAQLASAAA
jgi:UDP-N-acetylglucosamine 2-epimerase